MEIVLISYIIISVSITITTLILDFFMKLLLERLKEDDEYDLQVQKYICDIYEIISYNRLTRPAKKKEESEVK